MLRLNVTRFYHVAYVGTKACGSLAIALLAPQTLNDL
jgi:hypothetical protein